MGVVLGNKNMHDGDHKDTKRVSTMHKFFFLKPLPNLNADALSSKLLDIDGIEEVYVTEGDYGFLVKAKSNSDSTNLGKRITESMRSKYGYAMSYYSFKKK